MNFRLQVCLLLLFLAIGVIAGGCSAPERMVFSGTIEGREIPVMAQVSGSLVTLEAEEGDVVTTDLRMAKIDDQLLQWQLKEAEAGQKSVQAQWTEAKAGTRRQQVQQAASTLDQYEALRTQALARVKQTSASIEQMEAQLSQLAKQLEGAEETLSFQEKQLRNIEALYSAGAIAEQEAEGQRELVNQAETKVKQLQAQYQATVAQLEGSKQELAVAEAQPLIIQAQQQAAQAQLDLLQEGSTTYTLQALAALHEQAQAKVEQVKEQLQKTNVYSPIAGLVLRRHVELGELVNPGTLLFTIMDPQKLEVTVYLPEADLHLVHIGKEALIHVDAYPEQSFQGKVLRINDKAEFTPRNIQTPKERTKMVFAVTVQLTEGWDQLKAGMPADVFFPSVEEGGK